jgi:hypothetical protein
MVAGALALVGRLPSAPANTCLAAPASDKPAQQQNLGRGRNNCSKLPRAGVVPIVRGRAAAYAVD